MLSKVIPRRKIYIILEEFKYLIESLRSDNEDLWITKFEEKISRYLGAKYAFSTPSGRKGLEVILKVLDLNPDDEVIIPAYTLKDLINIIQALNLKAVPVDIDPHSFNLSPHAVKSKISSHTRVILATHLFGLPCEIEEIIDIALKRSIFVIEDCAHAIGSEYKDKKVGTFGIASFFSFDTIKLVNTYGGGMIVTDDDGIAFRIKEELKKLNFIPQVPFKKFVSALLEYILSFTPMYFIPLALLAGDKTGPKMYSLYRKAQEKSAPRGGLSGFQARVGIKKLETLCERIEQRKKLAEIYKENLKHKMDFQSSSSKVKPNYYFLVGKIRKRVDIEELRRKLLRGGIDVGIKSEIADNCGEYLDVQDCKIASEVYNNAIQLPLHEDLRIRDVKYIIQMLEKFL